MKKFFVLVSLLSALSFVNQIEAQVSIYADSDFGGSSITLNVGDYSSPSSFGSIGNDNISSIKVPSGFQVMIYPNPGFNGPFIILEESVNTLIPFRAANAIPMDNEISSIKVMKL